MEETWENIKVDGIISFNVAENCSLLSSGILYCTVQRVTIPDAVIIQFVLLKMGILMLETCRLL